VLSDKTFVNEPCPNDTGDRDDDAHAEEHAYSDTLANRHVKAHHQRKWGDGGSKIGYTIDDSTDKSRNTFVETGVLWCANHPVIGNRNA
jgi:hypothetical protein